MKNLITAIVITKNEEERLGACLKSLAWVDEIIVIDNGSTDKTISIAKKYSAIVYLARGKDFSSIREIGLQHATSDWIFYVDADESVTDTLRDEILTLIRIDDHSTNAYFIKRDTYYLGYHWPYQDKVERLFLTAAIKGWHGKLHESPVYEGVAGELSGVLTHKTHRTLEEMLNKTNEWSLTEAQLRFDSGHPPVVWWRFIRVMSTGFIRSFFDQRGWKAGTIGWIESIYQAFSMFITYAKLWELQRQGNKK